MSPEQLQNVDPVPTAVWNSAVGSKPTGRRAAPVASPSERPRRLTAWLVGALLAAAPLDAFAAQRGSQPSRPQSQPSRPQSQPSRPQSQPSRPQSQPSRPQSQPSRPQAQPSRPQAQPSRPQAQPSRPQAQPSRPQAQPSRPQAQPSRPQAQPSRPQAQPSRPQAQPSRPEAQPSRPQQQAPSVRPGSVEPSRPGTVPAEGRGWSPTTPTEGREQTPGNVIDFGSGTTRPPQRTTPLLETRRSRPTATSGADRTAPGSGPSSAVRARTSVGGTNTSDPGLESARRAAAARSTAVVRDRTLSRGDILQRYRGAGADATAETPSRAAAGDANAARIAEARRSAAAGAGVGADAPTRTPTRAAAGSDVTRPRSATPPTDPESVAARVAAGRKDYLASIAARTEAARRGAAVGSSGGIGAVGGKPAVTTGAYGGGHYSNGSPYNGYCHNGWSYHYGHSHWNYWGGYCGYPNSWWLYGPFFACGYWWNSYWYCGGYWNPSYYPSYYWYGPFLPYGASVIVQSEPEIVYVEAEPEVVYVDAPAGEAVVPLAPAQPSNDGTLNRAADYYLSLGDRAFREARYGDAAHYYAKAIEFSPDDGILHLVLADALFATGDYRYAAFALRTAFEKDPALAANVVDKRSFYANPADFDAQLALLERYLEDHFLDDDARLVLAANYLFGGRPIDTVKLLESPFSESLRTTASGKLMLDVARELKDRPAVR